MATKPKKTKNQFLQDILSKYAKKKPASKVAKSPKLKFAKVAGALKSPKTV